MNFETFKKSLSASSPPADLSPHLHALWYDGKHEWEKSHDIAQDLPDNDGSWIHAYLHRKEGDLSNAAYWYRRAQKPQPFGDLEQEWEDMVKALL